MGGLLIRVCSLIRSNTVYIQKIYTVAYVAYWTRFHDARKQLSYDVIKCHCLPIVNSFVILIIISLFSKK